MSEEPTIKLIKEIVQELGLKDKMDLFHWLMQIVLHDLSADVAGETKHVEKA